MVRLVPLLALALLIVPARAGDLELRARRQVPLELAEDPDGSDKPEFAQAADLDGDGRAELLIATQEGRLLVWSGAHEPLAGAPRAHPRVHAVGAYPLRPLVLGARVVIVSRADRSVLIYDAASLVAAGEPPAPLRHELAATPRAVALGDLGADGRPELVLGLDGRQLVMLRLADDELQLVQRAELPDDLPRTALVAPDGSGVVIGFQPERALVALRWDAARDALEPQAELTALGGIPRALLAIDLDHDGQRELAVACGDNDSSLRVFGWSSEPAGSDELGAWFGPDAPAPIAWSCEAIPIDLAPDPDLESDRARGLFVLSYGGLAVESWSGFTRRGPGFRQSAYAGQTATSMAVLTAGPGEPVEVAVVNRDSQAYSLLRRSSRGGVERDERYATGGFPSGLALGDFDADGRSDVLTLDPGSHSVTLLRSLGATTTQRQSFRVQHVPHAAFPVDLDRDGFLDLALGVGPELLRWFGDGRGGLEPSAEAGPQVVGSRATDLLVCDLGGDEAPEYVLVDELDNRLVVFGGDPRGELVELLSLPMDSQPRAVELVELDGDAGFELAVALAGPARPPGQPSARGVVLLDVVPGSGPDSERGFSLVEWARIPFDTSAPFSLCALDFDGDARSELCILAALGDRGQLSVASFALQGGPQVTLGPAVDVTLGPRDVSAADLDGDGRFEVFVSAQLAHFVQVWGVQFTAQGTVELAPLAGIGVGIGPMAALVCDLDARDGDGRAGQLELVVVNAHTDDVSVVRQR